MTASPRPITSAAPHLDMVTRQAVADYRDALRARTRAVADRKASLQRSPTAASAALRKLLVAREAAEKALEALDAILEDE